ncbi:iron-containing redox enzyme family protein [Actinomadura napierensis]|uniref:Iron-containing redox enzyme family protein n=1 Tax=Actinomadura napierensis TaxID=267854 RepID=A0ABN2YHC7_9ACTN
MNPPDLGAADPAAFRALYLWADDPEHDFWPGPVQNDVRELIAAGPGRLDPGGLHHEVTEWAGTQTSRFRTRTGLPAIRRIVLNCAPLALKAGAWLQWLVGAGNADRQLSMHVLALYAEDIGVGRPGADRAAHFRRLMDDAGLAGRIVPEDRLADDRQIADRSFRLAALLLAASRYPAVFAPELLGADLCLRWVGVPPPLHAVRDGLDQHAATARTWTALDLAASADRSLAAVRTYLRDNPGDDRPWRAVRWTLDELRAWSDELYDLSGRALDPAFEMAELLRHRAREARAYHHDYRLEGRTLAEWFGTGADQMLGVLARSRLVRPGRPDASPLLRDLIGPGGPMFRVFSPEDLAVIRRWIASLGETATPDAAAPAPAARPVVSSAPELARAPEAAPEAAPATVREAYRRLLQRDDSPAVRGYALDYTRGWLERSRAGIGRMKSPPRQWEPGTLRRWLRDQHDRHDEQFRAGGSLAVPPRERVIDTFVQLAPLNLIDGGWLGGFTDHRHAVRDLGRVLFATYWDELGNGEQPLNHPLIYRDLMREMGLDLPPTASREFAEWPGFRDESFELPVYWLALSRFPRTFLPETLGLNLAMELSGVGGTYRRDRTALRTHGFSSRYADVHNTIDNVATGHSAWAVDAIDCHLAALAERSGSQAAADAWLRIRTGFRSLRPPARRAPAHAR